MKLKSYSVTEINKYVKKVISSNPMLSGVRIKGEISNFKLHSSGHAYFSLKDCDSKIRVVMFSEYFLKLIDKFEDGDEVTISGQISVFERDGTYQLYARSMEKEGKGNLHLEFIKLKNKLESEGMFDNKFKKEIPKSPKKIGIVTSPTGAAIRDVLSVIESKNRGLVVTIYPVRVQGIQSQYEIVEALDYLDKVENVDLIILTRGGGSIEELWSFNEELVARKIFEASTPIISGVGHETDFTISDFVSDLRCPTPSIAAEIAVKFSDEIERNLIRNMDKISNAIKSNVKKSKLTMDSISPQSISKSIRNSNQIFSNELEYNKNLIERILSSRIKSDRNEVDRIMQLINSSNPLNVLEKGYSIPYSGNVKIKSIKQVKKGDIINQILSDGNILSKVEEVKKNDGEN